MRPLRAVAAGLFVVLLGAGGVSAWAVASMDSIDLAPFREQIVARVEASTGRTLQLDGALKLAPSLRPALLVEGLTLSNPGWATEPALLRADRVEARVDLWALLRNELVFRRVRLEGARLALETNEAGETSWDFGSDEELTGLPELARVSIDDGVVSWSTPEGHTEVELRSVELTGRGPAQPFTLSLDLAHDGLDLRAELGLGALNDLLRPQKPFPVKGELAVGAPGQPVRAELEGQVDLRDDTLDLRVTAEADALQHAQPLVHRADPEVRLPKLGGSTASARLHGTLDALHLADLQLETSGSGVSLAASGSTSPDEVDLDLALRAERVDQLGPRLREAGIDLDTKLPPWGPLRCTGKLRHVEGPIRLSGVDCSVEGAVAVTARGALTPETGRLDLDVTLRGPELAELPDFLEPLELDLPTPFPELGAYAADAHLSGTVDAFELTGLRAELGDEATAVRVEGSVAGLPDSVTPTVTIHVTGTQLARLEPWTGELPGLPPVDGRFVPVELEDGWRLEELDARVGRSDLRGTLELREGSTRARLTGSLIDVDELLGLAPGTDAPDDDRVLPAFDLSIPELPEGLVLHLEAERLLYAGEELHAVVADVRGVGDGLAAQGALGWHGTRFRGDVALRPEGGETAVDLQLDGATQNAGLLLEALGNDDLLTGGELDLDLLLHGTGTHSRDLLASSRGRLVVQVDDGQLANTRLNQLGGDLLDHLVKLVYPQDASQGRELHCAVLAVDFADGRATTDRGIALQTREANLVGSAEVELADESIDVAVHPYSRGGLGLSVGMVAKLMRFEGTLSQPHVVFDQEVVGKAAASAVAAVATSGLTLVAQGMFQRMKQDPDPCGTARQLYLGELPEVQVPEAGDTGLERLELAGTSIEVPELAREPVQDLLEALPQRGDTGLGAGTLGKTLRQVERFREAAGKALAPDEPDRTIELPEGDSGL